MCSHAQLSAIMIHSPNTMLVDNNAFEFFRARNQCVFQFFSGVPFSFAVGLQTFESGFLFLFPFSTDWEHQSIALRM